MLSKGVMASISKQFQSEPERETRVRINIVSDDGQQNRAGKFAARADAILGTFYECQIGLDSFTENHTPKSNTTIEQESKRMTEKPGNSCRSSVGMPYFKKQDQNLPSDNFDTASRVSDLIIVHKTHLLAVLTDMTKDIIQRQLRSKIAKLQKIKVKTLTIKCKIAQLKKEKVVLKQKNLKNMGIQADQDFGWEEVALKLNKHHPSSNYKDIWELFFHRSINKKEWSQEEHQELQRLVTEKKMQDWESIAKTLNTDRTAYQCFVYFQTYINHAACGSKWTQEEMKYLRRVVDLCREDNYIPWSKVASLIESHTKIQCYNKYMRMIEARKGWFIPEEDKVILNFVKVYGTDFRKMSSFLTGRSEGQLRVRYNMLLKNRMSAIWSVEDDKKLLQIMANQDSQANFSTATRHFPGKDRQNICSRYSTLVKWIEGHPHRDIALAPRRSERHLTYGEATSNLVKAVHAFRNKINELLHKTITSENRKLTRKSKDTLHNSIMSSIPAINIKKQRGCAGSKLQKPKIKDSFRMSQVQDIASATQEQSNLVKIQHIIVLLNKELADSNAAKSFEAKENKMPKVDKTSLDSKEKVTTSKQDDLSNGELDSDPAKIKQEKFPSKFDSIKGRRLLDELNKCYAEHGIETEMNELVQSTIHVHEMLKQLHERFNSFKSTSPNESPAHCNLNADTFIDSLASAKPEAFTRCTCCNEPIAERIKEKKRKDKGIDADGHVEDIDHEKQFHM